MNSLIRRCLSLFACTVLLSMYPLSGQERLTSEEIASYKQEVRQLISFMEFSFNTLGNSLTTAREKNTIINTSYQKIFRDGQVQIEDDLAPNRSTVTNKDVQSYLKDIDFFFKDVKFKFNLEEISHSINDYDEHFFLVKMSRSIEGTTVENEAISNTQPRFVEVNLDENTRELKIVSIYTTKLNELAGITGWWNNLPIDWKLLFAEEIIIADSLTMREALLMNTSLQLGDTLYVPETDTIHHITTYSVSEIISSEMYPIYDSTFYIQSYDTVILNTTQMFSDLKQILDLRELDLKEMGLTDVSPINKMTRLRRLNISGNPITSIASLKSLSLLQSIDCSHTKIENIESLQFLPEITDINISHTFVENISPLQYLPKLEILNCAFTPVSSLASITENLALTDLDIQQTSVSSLAPLESLKNIRRINCSNTPITTLSPLGTLPELESLICNYTDINTLTPLEGAVSLTQLFCENTEINSLQPLSGLPNLASIYCDQTQITEKMASEYMRLHPKTLVIYNSDDLRGWWMNMSEAWKNILKGELSISSSPSKAELQAIANQTELDIRGNKSISDLQPVSMLRNLQILQCDATPVQSLTPLSSLLELRTLTFSNTNVNSLEPLRNQNQLFEIDCSGTQVNSLEPISELPRLVKVDCSNTPASDIIALVKLPRIEVIFCESTPVTQPQVMAFLDNKPETIIIYHSDELLNWWVQIPDEWKTIFRQHVSMDEAPSSLQLHKIEYLVTLNIEGNTTITNLQPITRLKRLKNLQISRTQIFDLGPISELTQLEKLTCAASPLRSLGPISKLQELKYLDIANTPIDGLDPLSNLLSLESLICSGTQIKDLKPIASLINLRILDCSNTRVKKLKPLNNLFSMESLTCYNTRISSKEINDYKSAHPQTTVVYY